MIMSDAMKVKHRVLKLMFFMARLTLVRKKLPILIYHRVLDEYDPFRKMEPITNEFAMQMRVISENYETMQITDAVRKLKSNTLPKNALCITFDDGYRDNILNAAKILQDNNLTATFFIASGYTNKGVMWNDEILDGFKHTEKSSVNLSDFQLGRFTFKSLEERVEVARTIIKSIKYCEIVKRKKIVDDIIHQLSVKFDKNYMMTSDELVKLRNMGMEIGGHTRSHPILAIISDTEALQELEEGKQDLERILKTKITSFAYPNGRHIDDYNEGTVELVKKAGFECAVTTNYGISDGESGQFELNRISCWHKSETAFSLYLIQKYLK